MQERHSDRERYFDEQARTTEKYYIPYIRKCCPELPQEVLEVGCGEGGNLFSFAQLGCSVTGVDIAAGRIAEARKFFAERGAEGTFIASDIFKLTELEHKFSLILVHDVIEHIRDKERFLSGLQKHLSADGAIFVGFPAWQMPFGGHQQIAHSRIVSHFPFLHLLPRTLYKWILRLCGEQEHAITELLDIKSTGCTIELFNRIARQANYQIIDRRLYLINPHYKIKFGLSPRRLNGVIAAIPYIRNFFCTSCFYILKKGTKTVNHY